MLQRGRPGGPAACRPRGHQPPGQLPGGQAGGVLPEAEEARAGPQPCTQVRGLGGRGAGAGREAGVGGDEG